MSLKHDLTLTRAVSGPGDQRSPRPDSIVRVDLYLVGVDIGLHGSLQLKIQSVHLCEDAVVMYTGSSPNNYEMLIGREGHVVDWFPTVTAYYARGGKPGNEWLPHGLNDEAPHSSGRFIIIIIIVSPVKNKIRRTQC